MFVLLIPVYSSPTRRVPSLWLQPVPAMRFQLTMECKYLSYSRIDRILLVVLFARRRGQHLAQGEDLRIA